MSAVPKHALVKSADTHLETGHYAEAAATYREYLDANPDDDEALEKAGFCYAWMRKFPEAQECYRRAVHLSHGRLSAVTGLADAYAREFKIDEAHTVLDSLHGRTLTAMQQAFVDVTRGNIYSLAYDMDKAIACFYQAEKSIPGFWPLWVSLGHCHMERLELDRAGRCYQQAYDIKPDHISTSTALAYWCFSAGEWERGWRINETRVGEPSLHHHPTRDPFTRSIPRWDGRPVKTLSVWHEGGLGDLTHFMRYVRVCAERAETVLFSMPQRYLDWVNSFIWPENVKLVVGVQYGTYDAHVALMSLPLMLGLYTPAEAPPLPPNRMFSDPKAKRVILNWFGSGEHPNDVARSMKLEQWADIIRSRPDISWVNVSPEPKAGEDIERTRLAVQWRPGALLDAARMMLDAKLVISVDSAQAHMAGALGAPTWLMQPHLPEWRWGWTSTTPLYPSLIAYRQTRARRWGEPLRDVAESLDRFVPR